MRRTGKLTEILTFEFRYGTCAPLPAPSAAMTSPRALRLLLIACVSLRRSLSFAAPLDESLSDPAKSYTPSSRQLNERKERKRTYDQIQRTLTRLARDPVHAAYAQRKDRM